MNIEKLTRRAINAEPGAARYMTEEAVAFTNVNDKLLDLILNGPTINGIPKYQIRAMLREAYDALKRYEKIGSFATPFANDPPSIVALAFAELYPDKEYDAQIVPDIRDDKGVPVCGCTTFSSDPNELPLVEISGQLPLVHVPEILAHELAHVATGQLTDHGPEWEAAFEAINQKYDEIATELFGPLEELKAEEGQDGVAHGTLVLPCREDGEEPRDESWKLTTCPVCGAECWESEAARQAMAAEPELRAACTACALKAGTASGKEEAHDHQ